MSTLQVRLGLDIDLDNPAATAWRRRLEELFNEAPEGVMVTGQLPVVETIFLGIGHIREALEGEVSDTRLHYNTQSVFVWLLRRGRDHLTVKCTACGLFMGVDETAHCRCKERGRRGVHEHRGQWVYDVVGSGGAEFKTYWTIGLAGLVKLGRQPELVKSNGLQAEARRHILLFLGYCQRYAEAV